MTTVDIHPHIISTDEKAYPHSPRFGIQSDWSKERPTSVDELIVAMDQAGVAKAAVVHSSTCYGYDNSYVIDSVAKHKDRLAAVGSVDLLAGDAVAQINALVKRGMTGLRIFLGGSTADFDASALVDERSFPAWELAAKLGLSICIQVDPPGLPEVVTMAKRFPNVKIILDHLARPDVTDGPPYKNAEGLFALAPLPNIYLKLTPRIMTDIKKGKATPETFFPKLVDAFGAKRLAWGSNFPNSPGTLAEILATAKDRLSSVSEEDQSWIFGRTALTLYPGLNK